MAGARKRRAWSADSPGRVCMFVYNNCTTDARVIREARTLAEAGHTVQVVAVLDRTTTPRESRDGIEIVRIERDPPHYRLLRATRRAGGRARGAHTRSSRRARRVVIRLARALPPGARRALAPIAMPLSPGRASERAARLWRRALMAVHKPLMFSDYYQRAYRLLRDDRFDAFHAHDLNTLPVAVALGRRHHARVVYDAHELYPDVSTLSAREARVWRAVERLLIGRADAVVTVCDSIADELVARHAVHRPTVLLNCPPRQAVVEGDRVRLRDKVGLDGAAPIVLYQGGFAPNRGLAALVRSAHLLRSGVIVLMGWGRLESELRALVADERLERRVLITGPVAPGDLIAFTAGADVGVIPYEPVGLNNTYSTPNKLFEYMAAGLPIAASHLPELARFVLGLEVGTTFARAEPVAIAAALNHVLGDPERADTMGRNGLAASRQLCWEVESRKLLELYRAGGR